MSVVCLQCGRRPAARGLEVYYHDQNASSWWDGGWEWMPLQICKWCWRVMKATTEAHKTHPTMDNFWPYDESEKAWTR